MVRKKSKTELQIAEVKFKSLLDKRDELNAEARVPRDERNTLNRQKRDLIDEMREFRDKRDSLVKEMRKHKSKRNDLQRRAKELIGLKRGKRRDFKTSLPNEIDSVRAQIHELQMKQETTALSLPKENELIDAVRDKKKELDELEEMYDEQKKIVLEVEGVDDAITKMFQEADEEHQMVVKLSDEAQEIHETVVAHIKEISHLIAESDKKHQEFLKIREKADHYHNRAQEMRQKILSEKKAKRKELAEARRVLKDQNVAAHRALFDEKALDEDAERALEELLKKGKVSR
jgi:phosphoserine phosphatase